MMDIDSDDGRRVAAAGGVEQKMVVQWCLSAQYFSEAELQEAVARIQGSTAAEEEEESGVQEAAEAVNSALGPFALALRSGMDQTTGERRWAVVSTSADAISALGTAYTPTILAVLRHMLELITTDDGYAIDLHRAVREAAAKCPAGHSRRDAEDIIDRLDADGWLAVETQWVGIGQRACIELQPYLTDAYPDSIRTCCLCKEMATRGVVCAACNEALHPHCAERLASDSAALSCPACRQRMDSPEQFGPRRDRSSGAARQKSETPL